VCKHNIRLLCSAATAAAAVSRADAIVVHIARHQALLHESAENALFSAGLTLTSVQVLSQLT
jgi:hypothetical protein